MFVHSDYKLRPNMKLFFFLVLVVALKRAVWVQMHGENMLLSQFLGALSTDAAGELNIFRHDGDSLGMDSTQVCVLKETNEVGFTSFLKGHYGRALEAQLGLEILGDLTDEALEGKLADEKFSTLLITADLSEGNCTGSVAMGFLHSSSGRGTLPGCFGGQLLAGSFPSSGLASRLLGTSHVSVVVEWLISIMRYKCEKKHLFISTHTDPRSTEVG